MADIIMAEKSYTIQNQMVSLQRQVDNLQNQITKDKKAYQLLETEVQKIDAVIEQIELQISCKRTMEEAMITSGYPTKKMQKIVEKQQYYFPLDGDYQLLQQIKEARESKNVAMLNLQTQIDKNKQMILCNQNQIGQLKIDRKQLKIPQIKR